MDKNGNKIAMGLDVSTSTIGVCIVLDDGSDYGKILELTHISPKIPSKIKGIESLFIKKKIFEEFIVKFKDFGIDEIVIEEPLLRSNNVNTVGTLLRFNGMISDCVYNILGIVPHYISSYDARKYSFPTLMSIRKYGKDEKQYDYKKIKKEIQQCKMVLFGDYPWTIDKKTVIQGNVSELFPDVPWIYNKKGELKKENFDASDAYVACLGYLNKEKYGELDMRVENIQEIDKGIKYDVVYWNKRLSRITYCDKK
jgi:hypothetical protein|nr:MAG TPA: Monokaryotic chloroplast 1/DNA Complex junction resolvase-DNA complex, DNA [Caudoviricetes sp.]